MSALHEVKRILSSFEDAVKARQAAFEPDFFAFYVGKVFPPSKGYPSLSGARVLAIETDPRTASYIEVIMYVVALRRSQEEYVNSLPTAPPTGSVMDKSLNPHGILVGNVIDGNGTVSLLREVEAGKAVITTTAFRLHNDEGVFDVGFRVHDPDHDLVTMRDIADCLRFAAERGNCSAIRRSAPVDSHRL